METSKPLRCDGLGLTLLIATLTLVVLGPEVGSYVLGLTGLPDTFLTLWGILR